MNVLYITHSDDKYGAAISLQTLYSNIIKYGVRPVVVTTHKNKYNEIAESLGINNYVVPYTHCTYTTGNGITKYLCRKLKYNLLNLIAQRRICKIVDDESIDIIHINTSIIDVGIYAKKKRKVKLVWHIREFLDLDFNQSFLNKRQIERMNRYGDKFIYISNAVQQHWIAKGLLGKNEVVYNGLVANVNLKRNYECISERTNIAFVGNITKNKGQYQLIEAISEMPLEYRDKIHVYFYGRGSENYESELWEKITTEKLENYFTFAGFKENIFEELSKCSFGVVASKAEGFGRVTVEYMLSGLLVLASNCGANIELIKNHKTGLLYDYNNSKDLCKMICWALDHVDDVAFMKENAYKFAKSNFSVENYTVNVFNIYKEILNENQSKDSI